MIKTARKTEDVLRRAFAIGGMLASFVLARSRVELSLLDATATTTLKCKASFCAPSCPVVAPAHGLGSLARCAMRQDAACVVRLVRFSQLRMMKCDSSQGGGQSGRLLVRAASFTTYDWASRTRVSLNDRSQARGTGE